MGECPCLGWLPSTSSHLLAADDDGCHAGVAHRSCSLRRVSQKRRTWTWRTSLRRALQRSSVVPVHSISLQAVPFGLPCAVFPACWVHWHPTCVQCPVSVLRPL